MSPPRYIGRFAPSPTGPLHFGSLVAALGSYLQAKSQGGEWLVRMEDIDPPREQPGAARQILETLERYGLQWDGSPLFQHSRVEAYRAALDLLWREGAIYACGCSRKEAYESALAAGLPPHIYPGTCRGSGAAYLGGRHALRVRAEGVVSYEDGLQGPQRQLLEREVGDYVVRRADGLFAYQLAVVVDDGAQGITEVVRGSDLLESTPRQIHLQRLLGLPTPGYLHLPIVLNDQGEKLSKQTFAAPLDPADPVPSLWHALALLGQEPPVELLEGRAEEVVRWGVAQWRLAKVPRSAAIPLPKFQLG